MRLTAGFAALASVIVVSAVLLAPLAAFRASPEAIYVDPETLRLVVEIRAGGEVVGYEFNTTLVDPPLGEVYTSLPGEYDAGPLKTALLGGAPQLSSLRVVARCNATCGGMPEEAEFAVVENPRILHRFAEAGERGYVVTAFVPVDPSSNETFFSPERRVVWGVPLVEAAFRGVRLVREECNSTSCVYVVDAAYRSTRIVGYVDVGGQTIDVAGTAPDDYLCVGRRTSLYGSFETGHVKIRHCAVMVRKDVYKSPQFAVLLTLGAAAPWVAWLYGRRRG